MVKKRGVKFIKIVGLSIGVIGIIYVIAIAPYLSDQLKGYKTVLKVELPVGVKCTHQRLNTTGRERMIYDYRLVLAGDIKSLLTFVRSLGLKEENLNNYHGDRYLDGGKEQWWDPPSTKIANIEYRFFQKEQGVPNANGDFFCITQAELFHTNLYLIQIGDIKSLENVKKGSQKGVTKRGQKRGQSYNLMFLIREVPEFGRFFWESSNLWKPEEGVSP
jgi:hypothetical protein